MPDNTMTATQKREAIKIAKRKVQLAQEALIADFTREVLRGEQVSIEAHKAYKAYKKLLDKAETATQLANTARKAWYASMGMEDDRYGRNTRTRIDGDKVYYVHRDAAIIQSASQRRHNRVNKPSVDEVIASLQHVDLARSLVNRLEALQEFIDVDLPTDMWLSTTDAYKALTDIDAIIADITG